jgi:hypothetical protein
MKSCNKYLYGVYIARFFYFYFFFFSVDTDDNRHKNKKKEERRNKNQDLLSPAQPSQKKQESRLIISSPGKLPPALRFDKETAGIKSRQQRQEEMHCPESSPHAP